MRHDSAVLDSLRSSRPTALILVSWTEERDRNGESRPTLRKSSEGWGTHDLLSYRKSGKGGPPAHGKLVRDFGLWDGGHLAVILRPRRRTLPRMNTDDTGQKKLKLWEELEEGAHLARPRSGMLLAAPRRPAKG